VQFAAKAARALVRFRDLSGPVLRYQLTFLYRTVNQIEGVENCPAEGSEGNEGKPNNVATIQDAQIIVVVGVSGACGFDIGHGHTT
jgi:hypothetical protein